MVKLYLAQKMQILPKIPHGSNDELLLNIQAVIKQANPCDSKILILVTLSSALVQLKCSFVLLTVSNKPVKSCP